jgi:AhpC/TSA family protein
MPTLLINARTTGLPEATTDGDTIWLPIESLETTTGWILKPEGACLDERCVPIPPGREAEFVRDGRFNIAALAEYLDQPILRDPPHEVIAIGESAEGRAGKLRTLQAPDFTLPDLDGRTHSLSDYRGRKVFLASWASW